MLAQMIFWIISSEVGKLCVHTLNIDNIINSGKITAISTSWSIGIIIISLTLLDPLTFSKHVFGQHIDRGSTG